MEEREQNKLGHLFMGYLEGIKMGDRRKASSITRNKRHNNETNNANVHRAACCHLGAAMNGSYLSVRCGSSTLGRVPTVHGGITPGRILVCDWRETKQHTNLAQLA